MIKRILNVNGVEKTVNIDENATLADVLRGNLLLTGTKVGCGKGECGACSVIMNGKVIRSCITKMKNVPEKAAITTIEGVGSPKKLHALQLAWIAYNGAQCGFCTPGFIISAKALLDENPKPTREQVRDWFQKNRNACRCTGYKPLVDATIEAAKVLRGEMSMNDLAFKIPADGRIWGTKYPRPTAVGRVTGTIDYGADMGLKTKDILHLAIAQAKVSHANIISIDTSQAEKMPGVFKVLTSKDVKGNNRIFGLVNMPTNKGDGWDRPILCDKKIFQYGDAVAIVCADTEANARAAADKVKIELEELPAYMSAPEAMAPDALEIHPGTPNVFFTINNIKGPDTKPVMAKAAHVVEDEFYTQRQPHLVIEPDVGVAFMTKEGLPYIYSKSTFLHLHSMMIQPGIGAPPIIANPPAVGGMFGYKLSATMEAFLGVACMATGKPVTLRYDYYQQQTYTGKRSPFFTKVKLAADKSGKLLAMETDFSVDHGAYAEFGDAVAVRGSQFIGAGYNIPSIRGEGRAVYTNHSWGCAFRAFGSPQAEFASEVLMDELAEKIGMDPLEFRYKNVYRKGDTTPTGCPPDVIVLPGLIDMARPHYKDALKRAKKESTTQKKRGVGVSIGIYGCGLDGPDSSEAWAEITKSGVTIYNCWSDPGQGGDVGTLITAHEALRPLGITPDKIKLVMNDMAVAPPAGPSAGSRQQVITGQAIKAACEELLKGMKKKNGKYRTYEEMVAEKLPTKYVGQYTTPSNTAPDLRTTQSDPFTVYQYCLFLAEVEVDIETGKTRVVKMSAFADVGEICSMLAVEGQFYGGLAQGIGLALSEDFEDIKKHSTMTGAGLPFVRDVPDDLELHFQQTPRPYGTNGAGGCGEAPLTSPHASVINAIYNACGVRITKLPAYPEKVLAGLKAKAKKA
jgi:aldehyde oxidoreductase